MTVLTDDQIAITNVTKGFMELLQINNVTWMIDKSGELETIAFFAGDTCLNLGESLDLLKRSDSELQIQFKDALTVIERIILQSMISGKREGSNRLFGMDDFTQVIHEAAEFIAKHKAVK